MKKLLIGIGVVCVAVAMVMLSGCAKKDEACCDGKDTNCCAKVEEAAAPAAPAAEAAAPAAPAAAE